MKKYAILILLGSTIIACVAPTTQNAAGACDASKFQHIVGMSASDALAEIDKQPKSVQDMTIYSGSSETPAMLPKGMLVLEHSTPSVVEAIAKGGKVTKVYCNN